MRAERPDDSGGLPKLLACAGLGAWLVATAAGQHPHRAFDRVREWDPIGVLLPDWRFFAPEPAKHDFRVLHRLVTADGGVTPWRETTRIAPRAWHHTLWCPSRRHDKAMFDLCRELIARTTDPAVDLASTPPFQFELLRDFVAREVRRETADGAPPRGFQFLIARHTGHDQRHEPDYLLASPYVELAGQCGVRDRADG
jgi:hypothetical protein